MKVQGRNLRKTCLSILLVVVCLMTSLLFLDINARAETIRMGTVTAEVSLNLRDNPGTTGTNVITVLKNGDSGQIIDESPVVSNGTTTIWYKMIINGTIGWASSKFIRVTEKVIVNSGDFEAYLTAQGFPESYKAQLRALHAQYPNWVFEAQQTNLNWSDAIAGESALGTNLVHSGAVTSWKSTQNGAYDWENGEWKEFDSGGWVAASSEIIQYFMDPRNFLDSTNIFQFIKQSYNISSMSNTEIAQKKADLTNMVKGTYLAKSCPGTTTSYVDVIMEAAKASGVCPFTLASMMIQEQGTNGIGKSISGTVSGYEGYYNYLNIGAFKTSSMSAVERGLWFASGSGKGATTYRRPWNNATDSIIGGAIYYGEGYVNEGQDTLYLKKFNVQGSNLYGHQYMTNVQGAYSEGQHMAKAYDETARQAALVFKIPVYKNMPETACKKPSGNDNPNYMLKSLSVSGYSLTPTFSMHETSYSLIVPNSVSSVTVSAQAASSTTNVSGTGTKSLNVGTNTVTVTTKAQNGSTRTYTISIVRQAASNTGGTGNTGNAGNTGNTGTTVATPSIGSSTYKVNSNSTITGITSFPISATNFASKFNVSNGTVKITSSNGTVKTGNVGTGDQVRVYDSAGALKLTYNVVIYGDVDGNGEISTKDYVMIRKRILGDIKLTGMYETAANASGEGQIDIKDYVQVRKHILGQYTIKQ